MVMIYSNLLYIDIEANGIRDNKVTEINTMSVVSRQEAMQKLATFKQLYNSRIGDVITNETSYFRFAPGVDTTIGSTGFEGCFGVVIASARGCVVAHLTPTENSVNNAKAKIENYYSSYPAILDHEKAYIYAQVSFPAQNQVMHPELYGQLFEHIKSLHSKGAAPTLVKYIDPQDVCSDSDGHPLPGFNVDKSESASLVIKCGTDQNTAPIVQFITSDMQYHAVCV
jgi:hypothetical protein